MRLLAIAVLVLAGSVMFAAGQIAAGLQQSSYRDVGEPGMACGGLVIFVGSILFLGEYFTTFPKRNRGK